MHARLLHTSIGDLSHDRRVLRNRRKGGQRTKIPLIPVVQHVLDTAIGDRTTGALFATASGNVLDRTAAWRLIRRLAQQAAIPSF